MRGASPQRRRPSLGLMLTRSPHPRDLDFAPASDEDRLHPEQRSDPESSGEGEPAKSGGGPAAEPHNDWDDGEGGQWSHSVCGQRRHLENDNRRDQDDCRHRVALPRAADQVDPLRRRCHVGESGTRLASDRAYGYFGNAGATYPAHRVHAQWGTPTVQRQLRAVGPEDLRLGIASSRSTTVMHNWPGSASYRAGCVEARRSAGPTCWREANPRTIRRTVESSDGPRPFNRRIAEPPTRDMHRGPERRERAGSSAAWCDESPLGAGSFLRRADVTTAGGRHPT